MRIVRGPQPPRSAHVPPRAPTVRRGEAGERVVRAALAAALDDHYVLVHDLYLPGGEGDVDAVLIGPRVLALEIETYTGDRPLRVRGLRWEYLAADERWVPLPNQPSVRAEAGARRVAYALRSAGFPAYVAPVVALVGGADCTLERPCVPVLRPAALARIAREGPAVPQPAWPDLALRALLVAASTGVAR
jgi:hypothetical protein